MTLNLTTAHRRLLAGYVLSFGAPDWLRLRLSDDRIVFAVPSDSPDLPVHTAYADACTCEVYQVHRMRCEHI
jgi:hypothetical protein